MEAPIRVVVVDHVARMSGAEIATERLLCALGPRVSAHVVLGEDGPLVERLRGRRVEVTVLPLPDEVRELRRDAADPRSIRSSTLSATGEYVWSLSRLLDTERPDLVHTVSLKAALYGGVAGRLARLPIVWHIHDIVDPAHLPDRTVQMVRLAARTLPRLVLANSQATLDTLPAARRGRVVPNPVPVPQHLAFPSTGRIRRVVMVGRIAPWKGQHVFLEAFAGAFPNPSQTRAVVVGSPLFGEERYRDRLESLAGVLQIRDRVDFVGQVDDIDAVVSQADVLVHCSVLPEPFGQVITEAMALGVPVVAADAGGPREIISDGVDGLLTAPGHVRELDLALSRLDLDPDLRQRLAAAGLRRAQDFRPEVAAEAVLAAYAEVLGRRTG